MAYIKGLDLIAITDHNSLKQQRYLKEITKGKIAFLYGVEISSVEGVHILVYFNDYNSVILADKFIDDYLIRVDNDINYFGHQLIFDQNDQIVSEYPYLLISYLRVSLEKIIEFVYSIDGRVVLAHVLNKANGIIDTLGFINEDLKFDGIEIRNIKDKDLVLDSHPFIKDTIWFINSDSHSLVDINERVNKLDFDLVKHWWS